ncbi:MAG: hypothetical protein KZQ58_08595 [gamma proteobacterium symbiont of Bathyaustriella thionipta]|nr:hypothetical protein [gamma proteobacterium symbiont of Bathyaustriella thionipta]
MKNRSSVFFLIAANLLPLLGVLFFGWRVFPVLLLFWLENIVAGLFNLPRIWFSRGDQDDDQARGKKIATMLFFSLHYGFFTYVHGVFVMTLFGPNSMKQGSIHAAQVLHLISQLHLQWALLALFVSHLFSFLNNYMGRQEYQRATLKQLMNEPYGRVIILHLTILGGGFVLTLLGQPVLGVILLVVIKTVMDVRAHNQRHQRLQDLQQAENGAIS